MPGSPKKESNGSPLSLGRGGAQIAPKTLPPIGAPAAAPSPGAPSMPGAGSGVLRPASGARKRTAFSVSGPSPGGATRPMSAGRRPSHGVQRARSESTLVAKRKVSRMPSAGGPPDLTRAPTMGERAMSRLSQFFSDDDSASPSFQPASPGMEPIATRHVRDDAYLIEMVSAADLSGLILPTSRLRVFWDMMTMAMVMYTAISLPVVVVYPDFEVPVALTVFEIAMDVIFILDIGLNFRTAFVEDAVLIGPQRGLAAKIRELGENADGSFSPALQRLRKQNEASARAKRAQLRSSAAAAESPVRAFGADEESRQRRNSEDGPRRRLGSCSGGRRSSSAVGGGGEGGGGGGDYEGVRAAQQRLEGKIDEIYRMLRTQKTRDDA